MRAHLLIAVPLLFLMSGSVLAAGCQHGEIYSTKGNAAKGELTVVTYESVPGSSASTRIFEGWLGKKLQYRIEAKVECSNGAVICSLSVPLENGQTIEADEVGVYDDNGDPAYLVYANLLQLSYRVQAIGDPSGGPSVIKATWFVPKPKTDEPLISLPSAYRYRGCATGKEHDAGTDAKGSVSYQ